MHSRKKGISQRNRLLKRGKRSKAKRLRDKKKKDELQKRETVAKFATSTVKAYFPNMKAALHPMYKARRETLFPLPSTPAEKCITNESAETRNGDNLFFRDDTRGPNRIVPKSNPRENKDPTYTVKYILLNVIKYCEKEAEKGGIINTTEKAAQMTGVSVDYIEKIRREARNELNSDFISRNETEEEQIKSLEKRPEAVHRLEPSLLKLNQTALITLAPGPSTLIVPDSTMMEQDVHLGNEPRLILESESNLLRTTATPKDMTVAVDPANFISSVPRQSNRMEQGFFMMEQDVHKAMRCEVYPADEPQSDSQAKIKKELINPDMYKRDILSACVMQELRHFSKELSSTSHQDGCLFQSPVLIKEEFISFEEEL